MQRSTRLSCQPDGRRVSSNVSSQQPDFYAIVRAGSMEVAAQSPRRLAVAIERLLHAVRRSGRPFQRAMSISTADYSHWRTDHVFRIERSSAHIVGNQASHAAPTHRSPALPRTAHIPSLGQTWPHLVHLRSALSLSQRFSSKSLRCERIRRYCRESSRSAVSAVRLTAGWAADMLRTDS